MRMSERAAAGMRAVGVVAALILGATVSSCGGTSQDIAQMTCPKIVSAPGADTIVDFGPGGHDRKDVLVGAKFFSASVKCETETNGVVAKAEISFYAERANMKIKDATLPYFVAVLDPSARVLAQNAFKTHFDFLPGEWNRRTESEKITIHLPVRSTAAAGNYTLVVGFQLTPDQLAFNRATEAR